MEYREVQKKIFENKENITKSLENGKTLTEIATILDCHVNSLRRNIKDWDCFSLAKENANKKKSCKAYKSLDEAISSGCKKSDLLKKFLVIERGHRCEICKNSEWNNKPIPLQLHHIDGDHKNNRRDNLQLICPNCHSQTDSWTGKKTARGSQAVKAPVFDAGIEGSSPSPLMKSKAAICAERKKRVLEANIDFSSFGWVTKVAKIIDITPQKTRIWVKKNMPEQYLQAYLRNSN